MRDTLPAMYDLINKAEWRSHEHCVAKLLPCLKDAVYEAENLLDEFTWYEKKVQVEGNASQSPFTDFFHTVIEGSFDEVNDVQSRLDHLSSMLDNLGLHGIAQRFDKLVRPETTSLPNETKIFGRAKELKQVLGLLGVPTCPKRKRTTSSIDASTRTSTKSRISSLPVLVIAGIGGVGKTTLAQHVCNHPRVRSHFDLIIWICVSDDFDVKRLTKEVIQSCTKKEGANDNLNSLQHALSNHVNNKRLLIVLDDMWDDSLKENGQCWKRFCAPFRNVQEGSMILVTTRCPNVTEGVRTMEHVIVEGLKDGVFWNFFKLCAFGSESSDNDPELERIGQRILPKLKGSPLAAKTLGRMLKMDLQASHWNSIVESELWELKQKETDILPALRLSYMYLPFYLKQCFAFCAVYPKDYKFEKACLAEIWVAEGFVEPQGGVPIQDICYQYFEDLVARSFFQKVNGRYVIHDLLHDMAQKVSEHDCFILRNKSD
uniref:NB-ARC domain-containing protein n=1 Tax=Triticum urartu TaxID=4572 RepID=A0A8R7QI22_TRIUA